MVLSLLALIYEISCIKAVIEKKAKMFNPNKEESLQFLLFVLAEKKKEKYFWPIDFTVLTYNASKIRVSSY